VITNGVKQWDEKESEKPKRISATGTRPSGDPKAPGRADTYRVCDVKVGDVVSLDTAITFDGEERLTRISILRRPKGKIPPEPGELFPDRLGVHLQNQAYQDWEEKGVPIPKKYLSKGRAPWTNPPYPPVAPMPRAAKP
jgi:hypothetical protein